jgi:hypothetical protein
VKDEAEALRKPPYKNSDIQGKRPPLAAVQGGIRYSIRGA